MRIVDVRADLRRTSSSAVIAVTLALVAVDANAQVAATPATPASPEAPVSAADTPAPEQDVIVIGSRASQEKANQRKKNAATATDSIVADDIGSFPDRNVSEAMSRIPGVALSRNEFGEGDGVSVRGNGLDLTRVELDGLGVQSTAGVAANGVDSGRSADLRQIPAELVESIDVVKGSTADMTEGSLGGTVQVKTRSSLSFKKPYYSFRIGAQRNSLGETITPDFNAVATRRLFGGRLGLIGNVTYADIENSANGIENTTSNNRNYDRLYDFDQSAEKTFAFNPSTVSGDTADVAFANSLETPRTLVTKSAAATSKADCLTIFPNNPTAVAAARTQRIREQATCLNQWSDYTPSLLRDFNNTQREKRLSLDLRADLKLSRNLTLWGKVNQSNRHVNDQNRSRNSVADLIQENVTDTNGVPTFLVSTTGYPRSRTVNPAAIPGYYLFDPIYAITNTGQSGSPAGGVANAVAGDVLNVVPSSVVVDSAHYVTAMTLTNSRLGIDQIDNTQQNKSRYFQAGADFKTRRLDISAMAGMTEGTGTRTDMRTARSLTYGDARLSLQDTGFWNVALPSGIDQNDTAAYAQLLPAVGTNPQYSRNFAVTYRPRIGETSERLAKIDAAWRTDGLLPLITRVKVGGQIRKKTVDAWAGGGLTIRSAANGQPAIVLPTANVSGTYRACQATATSLPCTYGFTPSTSASAVRSGVDTLTLDQLRQLFVSTAEINDGTFFNGYPGAPTGGLGIWNGIQVGNLFSQLGANQFLNFDCVKSCTASDGNVYEQPLNHSEEIIKNVYGMVDFSQKLVWGVRFTGNAGIRGVETTTRGRGILALISTGPTATYDPNNPTAPGGTVTQEFRQNVEINAKNLDWLPSFNANLWGFDDSVVLRAYAGKTVARPAVSRLLPDGTCTINAFTLDNSEDEDGVPQGCSGRIGNPNLSPFTAWNYNYSAEWYPNRDTLISVAYHVLDVSIGNPQTFTETRQLFSGSGQVDPLTGAPVDGIFFNVPTYRDGEGFKRRGWEIQAKTAFTFLPWFLKYTGIDVNYSTLTSSATVGTRDPNTGDLQRPRGESKYYINGSLWYDDGKLNARVAVQKRSEVFECITPCSGGNTVSFNYPGIEYTNVALPTSGYNPGVARFSNGNTYIDAKIAYNIFDNMQVYLEARNLSRQGRIISSGPYELLGDGSQKIFRTNYGGRRFLIGATAKFGAPKRRR